MRRVIGVAAALICAVLAFAPRAEAQCGQKCTPMVGLDGRQIGWGCVLDQDTNATCVATTANCSQNPCGGSLALILDSKGVALASAQLCSGQVREVRQVRVVLQAEGRRVAFAARSRKSPELRSAPGVLRPSE